MLELSIGAETWAQVWPEAGALSFLHAEEVGDAAEMEHRPNPKLFQLMEDAGCLKITAARCAGRLIGYICWQVAPSAESEGLLVAEMGPWFVLPGFARVALQLFDQSLEGLQAAGVSFAYPHHPMQGRGAGLAKFFTRRGARPTKQCYSLKLGAGNAKR